MNGAITELHWRIGCMEITSTNSITQLDTGKQKQTFGKDGCDMAGD